MDRIRYFVEAQKGQDKDMVGLIELSEAVSLAKELVGGELNRITIKESVVDDLDNIQDERLLLDITKDGEIKVVENNIDFELPEQQEEINFMQELGAIEYDLDRLDLINSFTTKELSTEEQSTLSGLIKQYWEVKNTVDALPVVAEISKLLGIDEEQEEISDVELTEGLAAGAFNNDVFDKAMKDYDANRKAEEEQNKVASVKVKATGKLSQEGAKEMAGELHTYSKDGKIVKEELTDLERNEIGTINAKNRWSLSDEEFNKLVNQHEKARKENDIKTMEKIEYRLTDINFHTEVEQLQSGEYNKLRGSEKSMHTQYEIFDGLGNTLAIIDEKKSLEEVIKATKKLDDVWYASKITYEKDGDDTNIVDEEIVWEAEEDLEEQVNKKGSISKLKLESTLKESMEPFFFDGEDGDFFRDAAESILEDIKNPDAHYLLNKVGEYNTLREFVDNEFSLRVLGSWGSPREMNELYTYFKQGAPELVKLGIRLWGEETNESLKESDDNKYARYLSFIPSQGIVEGNKSLVGLDISDAKKKLGYWYVLDTQDVKSDGGKYTFTRAGKPSITLITDNNNKVIEMLGTFAEAYKINALKIDSKGNAIKTHDKEFETRYAAKDYLKRHPSAKGAKIVKEAFPRNYKKVKVNNIEEYKNFVKNWNGEDTEVDVWQTPTSHFSVGFTTIKGEKPQYQVPTGMTGKVAYPDIEGAKRVALANSENMGFEDNKTGSVKESYRDNKYFPYNPELGWTKEDIELHKSIDWKSRNYKDFEVKDEEFKGRVYAYAKDIQGAENDQYTFHKFIRSNPIYPPYYKAIDFNDSELVGPMFDGRKHGSYDIHDRYESQEIYDRLSESNKSNGQSFAKTTYAKNATQKKNWDALSSQDKEFLSNCLDMGFWFDEVVENDKAMDHYKDLLRKIYGKDTTSTDKFGESKLQEELEEDERAQALANYLEIDVNSLSQSSYQDNSYKTEEGDQYLVFTEDEVYEVAKEDIENAFYELGLESFTESFQDWILENAVDQDWFEEAMRESYDNYIGDIRDEEDSVFENRLVSEMVDEGILTEDDFDNWGEDNPTVKEDVEMWTKEEEYLDKLCDQDAIEWYKDNFGLEDFRYVIRENPNIIDLDKIVEEAISMDGVAHFIATYDGDELELENNYFAYRVQ